MLEALLTTHTANYLSIDSNYYLLKHMKYKFNSNTKINKNTKIKAKN